MLLQEVRNNFNAFATTPKAYTLALCHFGYRVGLSMVRPTAAATVATATAAA